MKRAIEVLDAVLRGLDQDGRGVILYIDPIMLHESPGVPGSDRGAVVMLAAEVRIGGARIEAAPAQWPQRVAGGVLSAGDAHYDHLVPLPQILVGPVRLDWQCGGSARLAIVGDALTIVLKGERRPLDRLHGRDAH